MFGIFFLKKVLSPGLSILYYAPCLRFMARVNLATQ